MSVKIAKANVIPKRQPNQYSCTTTSLSMAMQAIGFPETECSVEKVNEVLGAMPLQGASWDQVAGAASHFGCRTTLVVPSTLGMVRKWTDRGIPVLIGWNTGAEWSHASLIFDVTDTQVFVADPNIKNPNTLVRVLSHDDFYEKWWEKASQGYLVRRPAMAVEREISPDGRQMVASSKGENNMNPIVVRVAYRHMKAFQFALAQAFADQVGMPDRMNLAQLTKLLSRAFLGLVAELEWASEGLKLDGMTSVNLPYGSFQDPGWENGPPEQDEGSFDIPMGAVGRYTAWTTTKNLARALSNMWVPTQFFRHKLKEIAVFLSSSENRVLVEKFLSGIPLNNVVSDTPFAEFDSDALADLFSKNASSEITGTPGASASVGDVRWDFDGMTLMFAVTVNFSYDNIDELEVEPSEREPDYDDRWD